MVKYWFLSGQGLLVGAKVICWAELDTRFASHNQSCWHSAPKREEREGKKSLWKRADQNDSLPVLVSRRHSFIVGEIKGNMSAMSVYWVERLGQIAHDVGYRWSGPWVKMKVWREKRRETMFYLNILRETTGSGNLLCYNSVPRSPPSAAITASA